MENVSITIYGIEDTIVVVIGFYYMYSQTNKLK